MLVIDGSTTASTAAAVTTASMALPPSWITWSPQPRQADDCRQGHPVLRRRATGSRGCCRRGGHPSVEGPPAQTLRRVTRRPGGAAAPALAPTAMSWPFGSLTERPFATGIPFFAL